MSPSAHNTNCLRCLQICCRDPSKLPAGLPSPFLRCRYCGTLARKSTRHISTAWTTTRLVPPPCWYTCRTWSRAAKQPSRTASGSAPRCQRLSAPSHRVPRWAVQQGACGAAAAVVLSRCQLAIVAASKPASSQPGSSQTRQAVLPAAQQRSAVKRVAATLLPVIGGPCLHLLSCSCSPPCLCAGQGGCAPQTRGCSGLPLATPRQQVT
jgi:hypothetical protein